MALIDKASLLMVPSTYEAGKLYNVLPSGNRAPDSTGENSGYDQTRADFDFDRGSNAAATRVNADGLIEKYRENLVLQSNNFNISPWALSSASATSGQSGYDGSSDAWLLSKSAANGRVFQNIASSGVQTFSVYAKAAVNDWAFLLVNGGGNPSAWFDLSTGSLGSAFGGVISHNISDVGNGWYKISISFNETITRVRIYVADADNDNSSASGSIYIQDAQLESGLVSTDYLESTSVTGKAGVLIDLPRIDYSSGAGALLLEPSRQQLLPYSEFFGTDWSKLDTTITTNATTSPEGLQNATKVETSTGGSSSNINDVIYKAANTDYTFSVFAKAGSVNRVVVGQQMTGIYSNNIFDFSTGDWEVTGSGSPTLDKQDLGNGWWRLSVTMNSGASSANYQSWIGPIDNDGTTSNDTTAGNNIYVFGAQLEAGSYATSYIPNHGTSGGVTRAADSCSVTGASDVIGQTEGTLFVEVDWNVKPESGSPVIGILTLNNGANNLQNCILLGVERLSGGTNRVYCFVINSNVTQAEIFGSSITDGTYKIAFAYKANDFALYVNGSQIGTDTSGSVPALSEVLLGKRFGTDTYIQSEGTKQAILFNERLSNAELAALTA